MLGSIIRKEILNNLLSYKFSIITVLSTILILVSIFIMYRDYCLARENYEILRSKSENPPAVIPPTPLSIFAKGLEENLCRSYAPGFVGRINVSTKQKSVNKLFKLFTTPDLLYVVKVILSLCAILFAFDSVSGEKETGTLRQTISNTVKRPILILGKWIGGFTSFILPLFMAVLLGTIFVTLSPMVDIRAQNLARLGFFLLSSVIYLSIFFSLGLLISCLTHQSSSSLIISLFAWAMLVFLIPNLGNILARQLVQIPTVQRLEIKREQIQIKTEIEVNSDRLPTWPERKKYIEGANLERKMLAEDYRNRFNRLVTVSRNITRISPAAAFTFLATDVMGTGMAEERRLKRAFLQYRDILWDWDERGDRPAFGYQRSSVKEALGPRGLSNCLILILFNILFFAGAHVSFLRCDVR
jgi:ABC-type transport system involved in multi-copper enzyme maturation permease subunit